MSSMRRGATGIAGDECKPVPDGVVEESAAGATIGAEECLKQVNAPNGVDDGEPGAGVTPPAGR